MSRIPVFLADYFVVLLCFIQLHDVIWLLIAIFSYFVFLFILFLSIFLFRSPLAHAVFKLLRDRILFNYGCTNFLKKGDSVWCTPNIGRRCRTKEKLNPYLLFILLLFKNLTFIILKLITFSVTLILIDTTKD